ncbi:MAG: hypothetical protein MUC91_00405 [Verrucomicrobia bacterium]|nr:hypothetical protein [Verrucomicrobiota bacterium]
MKNHQTKNLLAALLAFGCLLPAIHPANASTNNLLVNGNFNAGSSGWTTWTWTGSASSAWANFEIPNKLNPLHGSYNPALVGVYDGTLQFTCGANGTGGAGAYQTIAATPGVVYTLTVQNGIEDWWKPEGEIRMIWLDATNGIIAQDVVQTACAINASCEPGTNDIYDVGIPYANWTNIATAPAGTKFLKVELADPVGTGSVFFDNAYLTAPIDPPVISAIHPNGLLMATNTLSFNASSASPINGSGIEVVLNGVDVSGSLVVTGDATNRHVTYAGLTPNQLYTAVITVVDTANLSAFTSVSFDTYAPIFTWEAEDYDFNSGGYINNPTPSDTVAAGSYFGLIGTEGVDFHSRSDAGSHDYRADDEMATEVTGDPSRQQYINAGASDYNVGWFDGSGFADNVGIGSYDAGEWVNYTRDFPAGTYNIYGRLANGNGGTATIPLSKVVSGWGTTSQTTMNLGSFKFPAVGWGSYAYIPLTDQFGNKVAVTLSGTTTLRVTAGSGGNMNFFMLMPVDADQLTLTDVYPNGRTLLQGATELAFTVSSASHSIPQSNVVVTLDGVDVSGSLSFSGSSSSWDVTAPLQLRVTNYIAVINVADNAGNARSLTLYFDTFDPASYVVEGEDFDFDQGGFIDNPVITSNAAANSYFNKESWDGVDTYAGEAPVPPTADFRYRELDPIATSVCTDTPMQKTLDAQATNALAFNYNPGWWSTNGWLNYTRTYPSGDFNIYGRLAGGPGDDYSMSLAEVNGSTNHLGTFVGVGRGYNLFDWVPLMNTNGQLAVVTLGGVTTLRATTAVGNVNPNNFLFVPAVVQPDELQWSYNGTVLNLTWSNPAFHLQVQTNNAPGAGISATWWDYPGGGPTSASIPVDKAKGSLFFRLSD